MHLLRNFILSNQIRVFDVIYRSPCFFLFLYHITFFSRGDVSHMQFYDVQKFHCVCFGAMYGCPYPHLRVNNTLFKLKAQADYTKSTNVSRNLPTLWLTHTHTHIHRTLDMFVLRNRVLLYPLIETRGRQNDHVFTRRGSAQKKKNENTTYVKGLSNILKLIKRKFVNP